ncbi:Squamous cell carcinoma antigen recognized by T-cells 3 [Chytridiales sp. JEL 0842]|nr:Squamous cell carcinoma antigen recognized by T-cells 3 [Chytridiales sp. JEL 0842]
MVEMEVEQDEHIMNDADNAGVGENGHEGDAAAAMDQLLVIMNELMENPYSYDAHLRYVSALRSLGQLDDLRAARQSMQSLFPLTEELWLEWIEDEKNQATAAEEKKAILDIFSLAVQDYLSIPIWTAYLSYAIEGALPEEDDDDEEESNGEKKEQSSPEPWMTMEEVRQICTDALKATELHYEQSHKVWNVWKDFELKLLEVSPSSEQIDYVRNMFMNRFKVPHATIRETFNEYSPFETQHDNANYEKHMTSAKALIIKSEAEYAKREKSERALATSGYSYETFMEYIESEKHQKPVDNFLIKTLYERAVSVHFLNPSLWESYITFLMNSFQIPTFLTSVAERAVRNCNWMGDLWSHRIRVASVCGEDIDELYSRGCTFISEAKSCDQFIVLVKTYCGFHRKAIISGTTSSGDRLRGAYQQAIQLISEKLGGDPYLRLEREMIKDEIHIFKNISGVRELYNTLREQHPSNATLWVESAEFERDYGFNLNHARQILKQAATKKMDWPERVFEAWTAFETDVGDVTTYFSTLAKVRQQEALVQRNRAKAAAKAAYVNGSQQDQYAALVVGGIQAQDVNSDQHTAKKAKPEPKSKNKRTRDKVAESTEVEEPTPKRPKPEQTSGKPMDVDEPDATETTESEQSKPQLKEFIKIENLNAGNMICILNLPAGVEANDLKEIFGKKSKARLVDYYVDVDEHGTRQGFVEFSEVAACDAAARRVGLKIRGELADIRRCIPIKGHWKDLDANEEKNKIYVGGLDVNVDKPALRSTFERFGKIRDIRLVLRPSAAFAYIEFEIPKSAEKACEMNNKSVEGFPKKPISVALSDPSLKKERIADKKELYVTNFPLATTDDELKQAFEMYGTVKAVRLLRSKNNMPKGSGFVEFESEESAKNALALNGTDFGGRVIGVVPSDPNVRGGAHKPATSFLPRAASHKAPAQRIKPPPPAASAAKPDGGSLKDSMPPPPAPPKPAGSKTQDDFRKLMMGGK